MRLLAILLLGFTAVPAFAAPGDLCFEDYTDLCGLASGDPSQVFSGLLAPLESQVPGYSLVFLWGGILAILWFKTENIMLIGLVGIFIAATITGLSQTAIGIGLLLLGVSVGILLFQLIRQRVSIFS